MTTRKFQDIKLDVEFIEDYEVLPKTIKKRLDRKIIDWSLLGYLPSSAQAHRVNMCEDDLWIVYLTVNRGAWRILAEYKEGYLYLRKVKDHELFTRELRKEQI